MSTVILLLSFLGASGFGYLCYFMFSHADWLSREDLTKLFGGCMALFCFLFFFTALNSTNKTMENKIIKKAPSFYELVACKKEKCDEVITGIDKNGNEVKFCQYQMSANQKD